MAPALHFYWLPGQHFLNNDLRYVMLAAVKFLPLLLTVSGVLSVSAVAQVTVLQFTRSVNGGIRGVTSCTPVVESISEDQLSPTLPVNATNHTVNVAQSDGVSHEASCHSELNSAEIRADLFQAIGTITSSAQGSNYVCGATIGPSGLGDVFYRAQFTVTDPVRYHLTAELVRQLSGDLLGGSGAGASIQLFHHNSTNSFLIKVTASGTGTNLTENGLLLPQPGFYELYVEANSTVVATNPATTTGAFSFALQFDTCQLDCPPTQYAVEDGSTGFATVTFSDPTAPAECAFVSIVCTPPSGSSFPVGTNTVHCVATDAANNTVECDFDVIVWDQATAAADDDGDGISNGGELAAGTDPFDADSALRIVQIARHTDDIRVTWETAPGKTNALQRAPAVTGVYSDVFTVTNTTGSVTNYLDDAAGTNAPHLFYRVRLVPGAP